jgi:Tfp pilus assembly protein PilO
VRDRFAALPPRARIGLAAAAVLVYAALLFLVFVSPKRSEVSRLDEVVAAAELRLSEAQAARHRPGATRGTPVSDVLRLAKAMPSSADQAGLVLELTRLAARSGIQLRSISSQPPAEGTGGTTSIPVSAVVTGTFRQLTRFLRLSRTLVVVRHGRLRATGRLLSVENVTLTESVDAGFPKLDATIELDAYVYDGPIVVETPPGEGSTEAPPAGTSAAGSTGS